MKLKRQKVMFYLSFLKDKMLFGMLAVTKAFFVFNVKHFRGQFEN